MGRDDLEIVRRPQYPTPLEAGQDDLLRLASDQLPVVLLAVLWHFWHLAAFKQVPDLLFLLQTLLGFSFLVQLVAQDVAQKLFLNLKSLIRKAQC